MKKKRTFCKTFYSLRNILKLQCLVDNLIGVLELPMFISGFITLNTLFNEVDKRLGYVMNKFVR